LARLIDGRAIAKAVLDDVRALVKASAAEYGRAPRLGVVLVGNRPDSAKCVPLLFCNRDA
jgi:5,10-methylene-tetrahydrofolate dehydrogenase/methenyl tetrahydrofolate cyclohydrolase